MNIKTAPYLPEPPLIKPRPFFKNLNGIPQINHGGIKKYGVRAWSVIIGWRGRFRFHIKSAWPPPSIKLWRGKLSWWIEYEGALYHVFSLVNKQQNIFLTDDDRYLFLDTIGQMSERFDSDIFTYVLMDNHYHLLLRTPKANLSRSMQWLGTTYTRRYNLKTVIASVKPIRQFLNRGAFK